MALLIALLWVSLLSMIIFLIAGYLSQTSKNGKAKRWYLIALGSFIVMAIVINLISRVG